MSRETQDEGARKMVFFTVLILGCLLIHDGYTLDRHTERLNRLEKVMLEPKAAEPANQALPDSPSISPSDKVTWKAIINYGGGYRVVDENDKEVTGGLNSYHVIQEALSKSRGKSIRIEYFSEETTGLKPCKPFGPS